MLAGELGEKYGTHHEYYNLQTPADAIKLLCINYPALKQEMVQAHHNGVGYKVIQGGAAMGYDELQLPFGSKPLLVVPVISGAGGGATTQILAGVGLVAASFLFPGAGLFGVTGLFGAGAAGVVGVSSSAVLTATAIGTGLSAVGASLILGGTASLISPQPQLGNLGANRIRGEGTNVRGPGPDGVTRGAMGHANYAFTGPANTVGTGATVPVIYGRVIAGSHLLAANLVVSDDSDPLKATTQAPGLQTFRINGDEVTRKLESHGGLQGRKLDDEIKGTNTDNRVLVNKVFGPSGDESLEEDKTLSNSQLKYKNDNRKKLDILFKIDKGLFDFVAGAGSTKLDGFIRYRITVELTGSGSDPTVASADVTVQGLLLQSNKILYGHRLEMPKVKDRDKVRVTVEIIDAEVHDGARLIFHAYGYDLL
nr:putative phage-related protein tail component [uncultured Mediterranean phage uvMED]BAR26350.1 putative phage-related protein tail component [uncultured Mediterranean phage uvMED]